MTVPAITISSNASKESVTSVVLRVILFGTIPTRILIIPDMPTDLPTLPELPVISPFLCLDDSESEWRDSVRFRPSFPSGSSSPDTTIPSTEIPTTSPAYISTLVIIASPTIHSRIWTTVRKSSFGITTRDNANT
nr:hypothetical protein [Tanacetum cinerariifolium]